MGAAPRVRRRPDGLCVDCLAGPLPPFYKLCSDCSTRRDKASTRAKDDRQLTGCARCGAPNFGRGARFCEPCRVLNKEERTVKLQAERAAAAEERRKKVPPGTRWCPRCRSYQPLENYGKSKSKSSGVAAYCRPCTSRMMHERLLDRQYGLSVSDYQEMMRLQNGRCAICMDPPDPRRRFSVDHDHNTGAVRGLLCVRCNKYLLGCSDDSPTLLRRAANYLERPPYQTGLPSYELDFLSEAELERQVGLRVLGP